MGHPSLVHDTARFPGHTLLLQPSRFFAVSGISSVCSVRTLSGLNPLPLKPKEGLNGPPVARPRHCSLSRADIAASTALPLFRSVRNLLGLFCQDSRRSVPNLPTQAKRRLEWATRLQL